MSDLEVKLMDAINEILRVDDTRVLIVKINKFSRNTKIQVMIETQLKQARSDSSELIKNSSTSLQNKAQAVKVLRSRISA